MGTVINIRNETEDITTNPAIIKKIMEYREHYDHKFDTLGEINLLTNHKLSKFNQDEIDNPNSPTIIKEIEFIM